MAMRVQEALKELGLSPGASSKEVKAAFRNVVLSRHPDRGGSLEAMKRVNEAKEILDHFGTGQKAYETLEADWTKVSYKPSEVFVPQVGMNAQEVIHFVETFNFKVFAQVGELYYIGPMDRDDYGELLRLSKTSVSHIQRSQNFPDRQVTEEFELGSLTRIQLISLVRSVQFKSGSRNEYWPLKSLIDYFAQSEMVSDKEVYKITMRNITGQRNYPSEKVVARFLKFIFEKYVGGALRMEVFKRSCASPTQLQHSYNSYQQCINELQKCIDEGDRYRSTKTFAIFPNVHFNFRSIGFGTPQDFAWILTLQGASEGLIRVILGRQKDYNAANLYKMIMNASPFTKSNQYEDFEAFQVFTEAEGRRLAA